MNLESFSPNQKLILGLVVGTLFTATVFSIVLLLLPKQDPIDSLLDRSNTNPFTQYSNTQRLAKSAGSDSGDPQSSKSTVSLASTEPVQRWKALVNDGVKNESQIVELIETALEVVSKHGLEGLLQIEDSIDSGTVSRAVVESIVFEEARLHGFQSTFDKAKNNLSGQIQEKLLPEIVRAWSNIDPKKAFAAVTTVDEELISIPLRKLSLARWAKLEIDGLIEFLPTLPPDIQWYARFLIGLQTSLSSPSSAISMFEEPILSEIDKAFAQTIAENWSKEDPDAALKWSTEQKFISSEVRNRVLASVLYNIAKQDPQRAIALALDQPVGFFGIGVEGYVIEKLVQTDPEMAEVLLSQVRDSETALYASRAVGMNHVLDFNFEEAIDIGRDLEQLVRADYFESIFYLCVQTHPIKLLELLDEIQTLSARSLASMHLIEFNRSMQALDEDQVVALRNNLTEEHRSMMLDRRAMQLNVRSTINLEEYGSPREVAVVEQQMQQAMEIALRQAVNKVDLETSAHSHGD